MTQRTNLEFLELSDRSVQIPTGVLQAVDGVRHVQPRLLTHLHDHRALWFGLISLMSTAHSVDLKDQGKTYDRRELLDWR
jgi:hypothetical protein